MKRVGSPPKLFKACCSYGGEENALYVALGSDDGKIWFVDPDKAAGNAFSLTFGQSRGMAEEPASYELDPMAKRETLELVRAYYKITDAHTRKRLFELTKALGAAAEKGH